MNAVTETAAAEPVSGVEIFVPLNKLKKSPRNARKVPHGTSAIEALAASIAHKGLIQNLAKVGVEGSNPFARSSFPKKISKLGASGPLRRWRQCSRQCLLSP